MGGGIITCLNGVSKIEPEKIKQLLGKYLLFKIKYTYNHQ